MARPTRAQEALIATRRQKALELRIAGVDILTIGKKLAADPAVNSDRQPFPMGYGNERYAKGQAPIGDKDLGAAVSGDIGRALKERKQAAFEASDDLRELEVARLDKLLYVAYTRALGGDMAAMDRVFKGMDRRAKLLGLDAPTQQEVTISDADVDAEILAVLGRLDNGSEASLA